MTRHIEKENDSTICANLGPKGGSKLRVNEKKKKRAAEGKGELI